MYHFSTSKFRITLELVRVLSIALIALGLCLGLTAIIFAEAAKLKLKRQ